MNRRALTWAMAAFFASSPAWADSSRLAFSKAENIEIFVEHPAGVPWCSASLDLRAVYHGTPDPAALGRLMPKLGALLNQQCPQATSLTWHSQDQAGTPVAQGSSSKGGQWQLVTRPVVAETAPEVVGSKVLVTPKPGAPAAVNDARQSAGNAAASGQIRVGNVAAAKPRVEDAVAAEKPAAVEKMATEEAAGEKAAVEETAAAVQAKQRPAQEMADFDVRGWKPQVEADVLAKSPFIKEMQDQHGCKIRAGFNLGENAQYVSLVTEGLACGPDGYAQGKGRMTLQRSDGAVIARADTLYFNHGYAFNEPVRAAQLIGTNGTDALWFGLGSNQQLQSYYLLRARVAAGDAFAPLVIRGDLDVLTAQESTFRQAADISQTLNMALSALNSVALPQARSVNVRFADSLDGLVAQDRDHMMYAIYAVRDWSYAKQVAVGPWKFHLDQANNYVFAREKQRADEERERKRQAEWEERQHQQQLAWEKRRDLTNKANEAEGQLRRYEDLVLQDQKAPNSLLAHYFVGATPYVPLQGGRLSLFYGGKAMPFQQIVHVDGQDGKEAKVDFPYDLRIADGKGLKASWYAITGEARADPTRQDEDELALTVVNPRPAGGIHVCKKDGCTDLADPLTVMRLLVGQPDWTPEAARKLIDQARAG